MERAADGERTRLSCFAMVVGGLVAFAPVAMAGNWLISPRLSVSETYTDNVDLEHEDEDDEFITSVSPGVTVTGQGARVWGALNYNMHAMLYALDGRLDVDHQFQADGTANLVEDLLFFDVNAAYTQQLIDPRGPISNSIISGRDNTTDVLTYGFSPWVQHHFGNFANAISRYTYRRTESGQEAALAGTTSEDFTIGLSSGTDFARTPWSINYRRGEDDNARSETSTFESYSASLSYVFSRRFRLTGTVGEDNNEFATVRETDTQGFWWNVGGTWTPSERTTLSGSYGKRFFGDTYSFTLAHRHKRLRVTANYSEDVTTTARTASDLRLVPLVDELGRPIVDQFGNPILIDPQLAGNPRVPIDTGRLTNEVFLLKRLDFNLAYELRRGSLGLTVFRDVRELQLSNEVDETNGISGSWTHRLSSKLSTTLSASWRTSEFSDDGRSDDYINISPQVRYDLARNLTSSLSYNFTTRTSNEETAEYTENRVTGNVVMTF